MNNNFNLTQRELEVLNLCAKGCSNPLIAKSLMISQHTVKAHVSNILEKLQVPSRLLAVILAKDENLIE